MHPILEVNYCWGRQCRYFPAITGGTQGEACYVSELRPGQPPHLPCAVFRQAHDYRDGGTHVGDEGYLSVCQEYNVSQKVRIECRGRVFAFTGHDMCCCRPTQQSKVWTFPRRSCEVQELSCSMARVTQVLGVTVHSLALHKYAGLRLSSASNTTPSFVSATNHFETWRRLSASLSP